MASVVAVVNTKGGTGKTMLSVQLAEAWRRQGRSVLLVDHDAQGSASRWKQTADAKSALTVEVTAANSDLAGVVGAYKESFDVIVIDAPPDATWTAPIVASSDLILIPLKPSMADVWACERIVKALRQRQQITGGDPKALFVMNMISPTSNRLAEVKQDKFLKTCGVPIAKTGVHQRTDYERTFSTGKTVFDLAVSNKARIEIDNLCEELTYYD